jgi:Single-strand binding protein family
MPEQPSNFSEFDAAVAGKALGAEPRTMHDIAHGDGEALDVGDTVLEVYRDAGFARVTTPDARIELYRVPNYTVSGERVVFEQGENDDRSRLLVRNDGKVSFYPVLRATETSRTPDTAVSGRQDSPAPADPSSNVTGQNDTTSRSPEGEKGGEVQQVQLQGRLGRDPWFSTRDDRPAAGFPLAVNPEDGGKTIWHNVVTFDDTAGKLHEAFEKRQIMKGKPVAVTGQVVIREEPRANGGMKKSAEFNATAVTRVQSNGTRPGR